MRISGNTILAIESLAQHCRNTTTSSSSRAAGAVKQAATQSSQGASRPPSGNNLADRASTVMKYILSAAAAGYCYDQTSNHFFLSTTSLHDGKGGFISNERLDRAAMDADIFIQSYQEASASEQKATSKLAAGPIRLCGNNHFVTMTDFRAATKVYLGRQVDNEQSHASLLTNIQCIKGGRINKQIVAEKNPQRVPEQFDLTQSEAYLKKDKYSLLGVPNEETGSTGYTSKSITRPFVNRGYSDFIATMTGEKAGTPKQRMEVLEELLNKDPGLTRDTLFAACQGLATFRKVYCNDKNWGDNEKIVNQELAKIGWLSIEDTDKIENTRPFQKGDMAMNILKRNTTLIGPTLHKADVYIQETILKKDAETIKDLKHPAIEELLSQLPVAHFKVNEKGNGFEDSSGLGDSFTSLNITSYINHSRLMSGEQRLSPDDVSVIIACLYAIDDANSIRHTLGEIVRGCYVGAGYKIEEANEFYDRICREASEAYYGGIQLQKGFEAEIPLPQEDPFSPDMDNLLAITRKA